MNIVPTEPHSIQILHYIGEENIQKKIICAEKTKKETQENTQEVEVFYFCKF